MTTNKQEAAGTIIIETVEGADYFIDPIEVDGQYVHLTVAGRIGSVGDPMALQWSALVDALNASIAAETEARFPDASVVQLNPGEGAQWWHVNPWATRYPLDDDDFDALDLSGAEWDDALDAQAKALGRAIIAHEAACDDRYCDCHEAVR